eukprot:TRINITY_DN1338_c0_g1_i3.p1 TRINITY_DN1338_c0_g1~~TRINITY_DN1338_c0_g1_i3.p1  ORF type:complete len:363 (+),score=169.43 TRINITY_DN1338_c0_g1_i3:52-1140(+)
MATLHVFLAGPGLIGGELLNQLATARPAGVTVKLAGVANSKSFLLSKDGIDAAKAKDLLAAGGATAGSVTDFVKGAAALGLPRSVFVDCTASDAVSPAYPLALQHNLHVATANKKVNSGDLALRKQVLELAGKPNGPRFRYEANVGAGLPIIRPLLEFVDTGDKVKSIQAILSGTLSFLFNTFDKDVKFSAVVRKAKELGFTEPDPRDDLSGSDVARKIVILARESGFDVSLEDVQIESFLPESCVAAASVDDFFKAVEADLDAKIEARRAAAEARGEVLRYIAGLDTSSGKAVMKLALLEVPQTHPAASVSGSDNICILQTERYDSNPCVVKGPGAGAAVTAAGVFADVLSFKDIDITPTA